MRQLNQIFTFYDNAEKQEWKRTNAFNDVCTTALIMPKNRLLPFQIRRPVDDNAYEITSFKIYCHDGGGEVDLLFLGATFEYYTTADYVYVVYNPSDDFSSLLACGTYYAVISDGTYTFYSRAFKVANITVDGSNNIIAYNDDGYGISLGDYDITNLVTNGTFDTDLSGWILGTDYLDWFWSTGTAQLNTNDENSSLYQDILEVGKTYLVRLDYTATNMSDAGDYIKVGITTKNDFIINPYSMVDEDGTHVIVEKTGVNANISESIEFEITAVETKFCMGGYSIGTPPLFNIDNVEVYEQETQILIF